MTDTYACGITMHRPLGNLYDILGVSVSANPSQAAERGYQLQQEQGELTADQRYAWKALSDFHYATLYRKTLNTEDLYNAGFFDDGLSKLVPDHVAYDPMFTTTPLQKLINNFNKATVSGRRFAVLVTTGGMAPIHDGHIAMMETAREVAAQTGFEVLAGYFAPGHDSYVGQKYGGTAAIPAEHRCAMVELATRNSDWLDCDPWAARYMPAEINFTDVVNRLENYIAHQTGILVDVIYVYGSDNEGFGAIGRTSICVSRSGVSSKLAREGHHDHLDPQVRDYLLSWDKLETGNLPYLIRNEENMAIEHWAHKAPIEELEKRRVQLQSAVRLGIAQLFKTLGQTNKVHLLPLSDQTQQARETIGDRKTISLDPFFRGDYRIDSTRYFAISEAQLAPLFRGERQNHASLKEQGAAIPAGDYLIVEDDCVTGGTIASAISVLPSDVNITGKVILSDYSEHAGTEYYDVVDLRDFIVGSLHGGLSVLTGQGTKARVPYALPYVSLRARAKIPAQVEMEVSRIVWQANVRFFTGLDITVGDCDDGLQTLAADIGFSTNVSMAEFCQWHVDRLLEPVFG